MRVSILLQITGDDGAIGPAEEVTAFEKAIERPEDLGLSIAEGKAMLAAVQARTVLAQSTTWSQRRRCCSACGKRRRNKGSYPLVFRTLYGDVELDSPRLHRCPCQGADGPATVSPLRDLISSHVAPERLYLEARWSSLVPYAAAAGLLTDVLPIASGANRTTVREHALRVAERAETELGDERPCFIDGCPAEWQALPIPEGRIVAALDGGYVRNWDDRKSSFELIVGRSVPEDRAPRYLGLVHGYDRKPKRRLFEVLKSQGLQANQDVTFLTDGGEEVRALTELVTPEAEHVLDWFHITMRLTVLSQYARGVAHHDEAKGARLLASLDSIKWLLWHGNQHRAGEEIAFFEDDVDGLEVSYPNLGKFKRTAHEFAVYIASNAGSLINYGERYRSGERISSCPAESTGQRQWKRGGSSHRGVNTPQILMLSSAYGGENSGLRILPARRTSLALRFFVRRPTVIKRAGGVAFRSVKLSSGAEIAPAATNLAALASKKTVCAACEQIAGHAEHFEAVRQKIWAASGRCCMDRLPRPIRSDRHQSCKNS